MAVVPWLDVPDADVLAKRAGELSASDVELLRQWQRNGHVILPGAISASRIDAMFDDIDKLIWQAGSANPNVEVLKTGMPGQPPRTMSHQEIMAFSAGDRLAMRNGSAWRLADFFEISTAALDVARDGEVSRVIDLILGRPSKVRSSATLFKGGETRVHQDAVLFACEPFNMTVTIGVAGEDINPDAGPLQFHPGTHKLPRWSGWTDYPRTMLKTCDAQTAEAYHGWLEEQARGGGEKLLLARKGDVILWHGSLAHKATKPVNPNLTHKLCVLHSFPDGCDRTEEVVSAYQAGAART